MPRVRPRSNVYAVMPILATLIMAFGITLTWLRIAEYLGPEPAPPPVPPAPARRNPEPRPLPTTGESVAPTTPGVGEEAAPEEVAPTEGAPTEGAPTEAAPTTTPATAPPTAPAVKPALGLKPGAGMLDEEDEP